VARELERLLSGPDYQSRAAAVGAIVREEAGTSVAVDAIEGVLRSSG